MSIENFPTEILERILNSLNLKDLESCRLVNRRWYDLSRNVLDSRWRTTCQAAFPEASAEARRKSQYKLSWEQLHRSLSLWPHMSEAKITGQSKPLPKVRNWKGEDDSKRQFIVLDNGLIATPIYSNKKKLREDEGEKIGDVWVYKYEMKPNNNVGDLSPAKKKPKLNEDDVFTTTELLKVPDSDTDQGPSNKKQKLDENTKATEKSANNEKLSDKVNTENHKESMDICENESSVGKDKIPTVDKDTDSCKTTEKAEAKSAKTSKRKAKPKTAEIVTDAVKTKATTSKRGRGRPKTAEIVTDAVKTEATTSKRGRGRPKTAEIVTDAVKTEATTSKRGRGRPKTAEIVTDAVKTEATTSKRGRGRPKTAEIVTDAVKTEASNTKKGKAEQEVQTDDTARKEVENDGTDKTEMRKGMRTRSANKKTMAKNSSETAQNPDEIMMNESGSVNNEDDKVFSKKGQAKNIKKEAKNIENIVKFKELKADKIELKTKNLETLAKDVEKQEQNMEKQAQNLMKAKKLNENKDQLPKNIVQLNNCIIKKQIENITIEAKCIEIQNKISEIHNGLDHLEKLFNNTGKQVKNKKVQAINKKSTAKNDNDINDTSTAKNETSTAKNETSTAKTKNEDKSIDDTVNKENMAKNSIIEIENDGKSTSNNKHTDDEDFDTNFAELKKKKKVLLKKKKKSDNVNDLMNVPCCNSILYLDIDTLAEHHLETYPFDFNNYAETDEMIVFRSCQGGSCKLIIGYKMEGKPTRLHTVGDMRMHGTYYTEFFIVNDAVYYQDEDQTLTKVSPKTDIYGEKEPEIRPITKFSLNSEHLKQYHKDEMTIINIVQVDENTINVLTDDTALSEKSLFCQYRKVYMGNAGRIYSLNILTEEFSILDSFSGYHDTEDRRVVHNRLGIHGFDFADDRIFAWLGKFLPLTKLKKTVVHRHDKTVIIGNTMKTLFIHANPFKCSGKKLYLYTAKPTIKVELKKIDNVQFNKEISPGLCKISQIDAIPTRNGLKIVVLIAETMVIVNLIHDKQPEYFGKSKPKKYRRGGYWVSRKSMFWGDEYDERDEMYGYGGSSDSYGSDDDDDGYGPPDNYDCSIM